MEGTTDKRLAAKLRGWGDTVFGTAEEETPDFTGRQPRTDFGPRADGGEGNDEPQDSTPEPGTRMRDALGDYYGTPLYEGGGSQPFEPDETQIDPESRMRDAISQYYDKPLYERGGSGGLGFVPREEQSEYGPRVDNDRENGYSIDAAVRHLDIHSKSKTTSKCAKFVREAMQAGGARLDRHPVDAMDYGPTLRAEGFSRVDGPRYRPRKGDVAVFEAAPKHDSGHIQMYNDKLWVSDFRQNSFWPWGRGKEDKPKYEVYRW